MIYDFFRRFRFEALLGLKVLASFLLLLWLRPPLFPDEAQYWVWSGQLDIGYYSKPPGIAWLIALVSSVFGDYEWAIRLPSVIMSSLGAWYLAAAMRFLGAAQTNARYSAWLFLFSPIVLYGSFAATTDAGLLLGWCAALCYLEKPFEKTDRKWLVFWTAWGMLFKPTIFILTLFSWLRFSDPCRKQKAFLLLLGCLLGSICPVIWNLEHGGVTFLHVWTQLFVAKSSGDTAQASFWESLHFRRVIEFLLIQCVLFSPWVSWRLMSSAGTYLKDSSSKALRWHTWLALTILAFTVLGSLRIKFQANWPLVAFPSLFCLLSQSHLSRKWIGGHALVHSLLFICALLISTGQSRDWDFVGQTSKKINIFRSVEGWQTIRDKLPETPWKEEEGFWLADKYQTVSLLSFYGPSKQVYWFNLHGARKNQFSFHPVETRFLGSPARFVAVEAHSLEEMESAKNLFIERLKPFFQEIVSVRVIPLWTYQGRVQRSALVIDLRGYLGQRPKDPESY